MEVEITARVNVTPDPRIDDVLARLDQLDTKGNAIMADLSRLTNEVAEARTVQASAVALLGNLAQQIRDLSTDPAALAALADDLDSSSNELAAAIEANTPQAPTEPTEPSEPTEPTEPVEPTEPPAEPDV